MNKRAGPLVQILLEIDEFLLTRMKISIINSHKWAGLAAGMKVQRCGASYF